MKAGQLGGGSRRALILAREAALRQLCHTTPHFPFCASARLNAVITCCEIETFKLQVTRF